MQPQPQPFTRRYPTDAHYTSDAQNLAAAGWRVASVQREPSGGIIATYAPVVAPAAAPTQLLRPRWQIAPRQQLGLAAAVFGVVALLAILATIFGALARPAPPSALSASSGAEATNAAFATSLDATATALSAQATSTPAPVFVSGAHLGGPLSDFDTAFGSEVSQGFWNTTIDGQPVQLVIAGTRLGDSADSQDRAVVIDVDGADTHHAWTLAQENGIVASFMPPDAVHRHDVAGWGSLGPDHIFISDQLATSLVASVFQDANNQTLPPGTFDWQCSTSQQLCEIAAGTNS